MALQANPVNLNSARLQRCDEGLGGCCFSAGTLDIVVVVVQLDGGIIESRGLEGDWDVFRTNGSVKNVGSVRPIVGQSLIDDVPGVALTLVVCDFILDVILKDRNQGCVGPSA